MNSRWTLGVLCFALAAARSGIAADPPQSPEATSAASPESPGATVSTPYRLEKIRGRVVWLAEAMERRSGVHTVPEARQRVLAIQTLEGVLHPLLEDVRARAFRVDERLRQMDVELLVRRYNFSPSVQIIRVFEVRDGRHFEIDYWCDTCAITMYEQGLCSCCQEPNRLRRTEVAALPAISAQ